MAFWHCSSCHLGATSWAVKTPNVTPEPGSSNHSSQRRGYGDWSIKTYSKIGFLPTTKHAGIVGIWSDFPSGMFSWNIPYPGWVPNLLCLSIKSVEPRYTRPSHLVIGLLSRERLCSLELSEGQAVWWRILPGGSCWAWRNLLTETTWRFAQESADFEFQPEFPGCAEDGSFIFPFRNPPLGEASGFVFYWLRDGQIHANPRFQPDFGSNSARA